MDNSSNTDNHDSDTTPTSPDQQDAETSEDTVSGGAPEEPDVSNPQRSGGSAG